MAKYREKQRQIDETAMPNRFVVAMAAKGFSAQCITNWVNRKVLVGQQITTGQVSYRIHKAGLSLRAYRNGNTVPAVQELHSVHTRLYGKSKTKAS